MSLTPSPDEPNAEPQFVDSRSLLPQESALRRELREYLEATLARLDLVGRAALILRDIEDHSYQEIVEILGIGLSAVKMRIHRARLTFQQLLDVLCPGVRGDQTVEPDTI